LIHLALTCLPISSTATRSRRNMPHMCMLPALYRAQPAHINTKKMVLAPSNRSVLSPKCSHERLAHPTPPASTSAARVCACVRPHPVACARVRMYECNIVISVWTVYPFRNTYRTTLSATRHRGGRLAPPARGPAAKTYPLLTPADRRAHFYIP
jgi:hypothetical protein